ncbi:MAG: hypothetical protein DRK00_11635 [Thermoprotei archaeon]|nr:MAG: hypothetical protein DRK00_11635 [Thermoprotei archaeon]
MRIATLRERICYTLGAERLGNSFKLHRPSLMMSAIGRLRRVPLEKLRISAYNVRTKVDEEKVLQLMESIANIGLQQPLVVMPSKEVPGADDGVIGRRRLEAIRRLREGRPGALEKWFSSGVPCLVRDFTPREAIMASLVENLQRGDLRPEEVGEAVNRLQVEYGMSLEDVVAQVKVEMGYIKRALEMYYELTKHGLTPSRPGRPPKRGRRGEVPAVAAKLASRLEEQLATAGVDERRAELAKKLLIKETGERGLSGKAVELVVRGAVERVRRGEDPVRAVRELVERISSEKYKTRVITLPAKFFDLIAALAVEKRVSFDRMLEEVVRAGLKAMGIEL